MTTRMVRRSDGRVLQVHVSGPAEGTPLVFHHGTPGSHVPYAGLEEMVAGRGLRLVVVSRPGYARSTRAAGRTVVDVVADTEAVLTALDATECLVAGMSGGGPHALACAARLPGARAALVVSGSAPADELDAPFTDGMSADNVTEFSLAARDEPALRTMLEEARQALVGDQSELVLANLLDGLPEVDRASMSQTFAAALRVGIVESVRVDVDGWLDDDLALVRPWGLAIDEVGIPVSLWWGAQDVLAPPAHGDLLAARLPDVHAHRMPADGHLSVLTRHLGDMLDELVDLAG